jgi:hypothetical protein
MALLMWCFLLVKLIWLLLLRAERAIFTTHPAAYSEVDNPNNIDPLNFFDAEELPDLNRVTINIANNLYIGGTESFEIYRSSGDVTAPFIRWLCGWG